MGKRKKIRCGIKKAIVQKMGKGLQGDQMCGVVTLQEIFSNLEGWEYDIQG